MTSMDEVLSGLDRIAWSEMRHDRGPAGDLPALIRTALTATRASERRDARHALWERIQHQGSIVESTASVVPFLARALPLARKDDRASLVSMIGQLAYGRTKTEGDERLQRAPEGPADRREIEAQHARERAWVGATRRASWSALEPLLALLDDDDEDLLVQVPFALVALVEGAREGVPAGTDVAKTTAQIADAIGARAARPATLKALTGFAFALGVLARELSPWADRLEGAFSGAPPPVRCAIALSLAPVRPTDPIADALIDALRARAEHETWVPYPFPWRSGHLRFQILRALAEHASDEAFDRALPVIADVLRAEASQSTFAREGLPVLVRALGTIRITATTTESDLPRAARVVLGALYDSPSFWAGTDGDADDVLRSLGLENDHRTWRTLLGR